MLNDYQYEALEIYPEISSEQLDEFHNEYQVNALKIFAANDLLDDDHIYEAIECNNKQTFSILESEFMIHDSSYYHRDDDISLDTEIMGENLKIDYLD